MTTKDLFDLLASLGIERLKIGNGSITGLCPFHEETRPSWGIKLEEPHPYGCFGCGETGTLYSLLKKISNLDDKSIRRYCLMGDGEQRLAPLEKTEKSSSVIDKTELYCYSCSSKMFEYLRRRGVPDSITKEAKCTYDRFLKRILFPWYVEGQLVGVTGRAIDENPVKTLPYFSTKKGNWLYFPRYFKNSKKLVLVEGEIDALKVLAATGMNVAALGFGSFSNRQALLIIHLGIAELVVFTDLDETGERIYSIVNDKLSEHLKISKVDYSLVEDSYEGKLDPAALSLQDIHKLLESSVKTNAHWIGLES